MKKFIATLIFAAVVAMSAFNSYALPENRNNDLESNRNISETDILKLCR